jgi:hypothetical protein
MASSTSATNQPNTAASQPAAQPTKVESNLQVPASSKGNNQSTEKENVGGQQTTSTPGHASAKTGLDFPVLFKNATASQKTTLALLVLVASLFIVDSIIMFRRRHVRANSHSLAHAAVLLLLIAVSLLYGNGSVI